MADIETAMQTAFVFGAFIIVAAVLWILWLISPQLLGILLIALGAFMVVKLPGISKYEKAPMTSAVIAVGILLIIIGVFLIIPANYLLPAILVVLGIVGTLVIITSK